MLFLSSTIFSSECVVFGVIISPTKKGGRDALVVVLRSGRRQLRERERGERGRFEFAELEEVNTWKKEEQTFHMFWIYESFRGFSMQFSHVYLIMWISFFGIRIIIIIALLSPGA
jgi:hypothetical protein